MPIQGFQSQIFPAGLMLNRCIIRTDPGIWEADPNATFRMGQLVNLNSSGLVQKATSGVSILGVAKATKDVGFGNSVVVDEQVVLNGTTTTALKYGSIIGTSTTNNSIKVSLTAGGAALTQATDYDVISLANGTIARKAGGAIADGATVFASYTRSLTSSEMAFQGNNFFNTQDDVSVQGNRVAVIMDWAVLFTTEYDTSRRYQINDLLYAGQNDAEVQGLVSNDATEGDPIGRVTQIPTATDPYLGFILILGQLIP